MKKIRPISNLVYFQGQWMTEIDMKVRVAYHIAKRDDIKPKRVNGKIVGFYILNEGGETAIATL